MLRTAFFLALAAAAGAQEPPASAPPVLGYFTDVTGSRARIIIGVPGAARAVAGPQWGRAFTRVQLAPGKPYGVAVEEGGDALRVVTFDANAAEVRGVDASGLAFDLAAFAESGTAAFYDSACSCVRVFRGLPAEAALARSFDVSERPLAIAVFGEAVALVYADRVEVLGGEGQLRTVPGVTGSRVAFGAAGVAVLDVEARRVRVVADPWGSGNVTDAADENQGLVKPVDVAIDAAGRVLIADAAGAIHVVQGDERRSIACDCVPEVVERAAAPATYRLTGGRGPVWMVSFDAAEPRVFFVPVEPVVERSGDQLQ